MKNKKVKLELQKFQIAKLNNLSVIKGGVGQILKTEGSKKCSAACDDPDCEDDFEEQC